MKITTIIVFFLFVTNLNAQTELIGVFNDTHSGRNLTLSFSKTFNINEIGIGLKYNIKKIAHNDDRNEPFKNRLHTNEPIHYIGLDGFFNRHIFSELQKVKPFLFYNLQFSYMPSRNSMFLPTQYIVEGKPLYKLHVRTYGPYYWIEQYAGVGYKALMTKQLHFIQRLGYGPMMVLGKEEERLDKDFDGFACEFGFLIQAGMVYRFK